LPDECWILLDGDTVLRNKKQFVKDGAVVVYGDPYEYFEPYFIFIKYSLGLEKNNLPSFMSPYWLCERQVLEAIEYESIKRNNTDIVSAWKHYYRHLPNSSYQSLSEVELYGVFATQVLNKNFEFAPQNLKCCLTSEFLEHWNTSQDLCLGGPDDFPASFWNQQGIPYHRDLAVELNYKNIN
jgi:hypothetical protein